MGVVYLELGELFCQVFVSIIEGIEDKFGGLVVSLVIGSVVMFVWVVEELYWCDVQVLIGLGCGGMCIVIVLVGELIVLVGCVVLVYEFEVCSFFVYMLVFDLVLLLVCLKWLWFGVCCVYVVYDFKFNMWFVKFVCEVV